MDNSSMKKCTECGQTNHTPIGCNNGRVGIITIFGNWIDPKIDSKADEIRRTEKEDEQDDQDQLGVNSLHKCKSLEILNVPSNEHTSMDREYLSDEHLDHRKKGIPWTEDEHRSFLVGLEELGKGRWRAISNKYVPSRTPTQVASHAQKYFIRMNASQDKLKRRSSLFDVPPSTAPIAPPSTSARPPLSRMIMRSVPDYFYTHKGYEKSNEQRSTDSPVLLLADNSRPLYIPRNSWGEKDRIRNSS